MSAVYRWNGQYFGFIRGNRLLDANGNYIGWTNEDRVRKADGTYLGEVGRPRVRTAQHQHGHTCESCTTGNPGEAEHSRASR